MTTPRFQVSLRFILFWLIPLAAILGLVWSWLDWPSTHWRWVPKIILLAGVSALWWTVYVFAEWMRE